MRFNTEKREASTGSLHYACVCVLKKLYYSLPLSTHFIFVYKLHPLCQTPLKTVDSQSRCDIQGGVCLGFFKLLLKNQHVNLLGYYKLSHHLIQGFLILVDSLEFTDRNCPHAMAQSCFLLLEFSLWKIIYCATSKAQGKHEVLHTGKKKFSRWASQIHSSRYKNDKTHILAVNTFRFFYRDEANRVCCRSNRDNGHWCGHQRKAWFNKEGQKP